MHVENKAEFENVGQWKRRMVLSTNGENMHDAVQREKVKRLEIAGNTW